MIYKKLQEYLSLVNIITNNFNKHRKIFDKSASCKQNWYCNGCSLTTVYRGCADQCKLKRNGIVVFK